MICGPPRAEGVHPGKRSGDARKPALEVGRPVKSVVKIQPSDSVQNRDGEKLSRCCGGVNTFEYVAECGERHQHGHGGEIQEVFVPRKAP